MADPNFKFCTACGRKVALNAHFCGGCGADLAAHEQQNVMQNAVREEVVVGYTPGVFLGSFLVNGVLLFTTDRTVVAKTSRYYIRHEGERMARSEIDEILSEDKNNYAIPHSEITQLRVKLPGVLTNGRVTLTTAQWGEKVFKIGNRGVAGIKDDWGFLKSPPPKLAGKLVVE